VKPEDIKGIGIMGGGTMGSGIAQTAILAGYKTIVRDLSDQLCERARNTIVDGRFGLKGGVERGKITQAQMDRAVSNLSTTTKVEDLKNCDLIIETIGLTEKTSEKTGWIESKPLKLKVFAELDEIVKKDAIFASNTSLFTIADLAKAVKRKDKFIGMHWFRPANIMKVVEVIYTADTSKETIQILKDVAQRFGKTAVLVKDVPGDKGFVGNRIMWAVREEAFKIVREGIATEEDVDTVMTLGFNWPAGPFTRTAIVRSDDKQTRYEDRR
jgi:3-hydroxybutyryl-CoA dehydrogenase